MATALSRAYGEPVRYNDVPADVYRGFGFPGADDVGTCSSSSDFDDVYTGNRDLALSHRLNPEMQTFDGWLAANVGRIPAA
jgi:hypothetical protein